MRNTPPEAQKIPAEIIRSVLKEMRAQKGQSQKLAPTLDHRVKDSLTRVVKLLRRMKDPEQP